MSAKYGDFNSQIFTSNIDINNFFKTFNTNGFVEWFNANIVNTNYWTKDYLGNTHNYTINKQNWEIIWSNLPIIFGRDSINLIEFLCMNSIITNETIGNFVPNLQDIKQNTDLVGITYEFNSISGIKSSYNTIKKIFIASTNCNILPSWILK